MANKEFKEKIYFEFKGVLTIGGVWEDEFLNLANPRHVQIAKETIMDNIDENFLTPLLTITKVEYEED